MTLEVNTSPSSVFSISIPPRLVTAGRDVGPPAPASYRRHIGGHHRVPQALAEQHLVQIIAAVLLLSLPARLAGGAGTPGPLDPEEVE